MRLHPPRLGRSCGLLRRGTGLPRCARPWSAGQVQRQPYRALRLQRLPGGYYGYWQCQRRGLSSSLPDHCSRQGDDEAPGSTIFALSSAPGRAAIAVIRISGPACLCIYSRLCPDRPVPKPRYATVRTLFEPGSPSSKDDVLDASALVLYMPGPRTVTGEDILELHVHGGTAVVKAVLAAVSRCGSLGHVDKTPQGLITYAEPGEFTRRAFINDRLDLTQIEALGDTLAATTEQQRRMSVRGTTGGLTKRYEAWRHMLLHARGELEALIDFSEDQHFEESPATLVASVASQVEALASEIKAHCTNASRGELIRNGISLSLLGAPNAGKSSLLNRIVGREAAIVSAEAGTTRDVVDVGVDLGGWYCQLGDMAGIRVEPTREGGITRTRPDVGIVEQEGIKRAKQRALESDVVLVVLSLETDPKAGRVGLRMEPEVIGTAKSINDRAGGVVVVVNKMDYLLADSPAFRDDLLAEIKSAIPNLPTDRIFWISCKDANSPSSLNQDPGNIQHFLTGLVQVFRDLTLPFIPSNEEGDFTEVDKSMWEESLGTNARQRTLLDDSLRNLDKFLREVKHTDVKSAINGTVIDGEIDIVVAAESLRLAAACIGKITGRGDAGDVEEVLGVVFEKFCVGK